MKTYEALARALADDHQVEVVFGIIGEANMMLVDTFVRNGGSYINPPREDGAVLAAFGYAHSTGRLGVATVTHGPALTNTVTALTEATRNRVPMLLIAGDTAADSRRSIQDIDQQAVVIPSGAGFHRVRTPDAAVEDLALAVRRAFAESRPVVLDVPIDLQERDTEWEPSGYRTPPAQRVNADPDALDRALGMLASARRPVVLAGRGAVHSGARSALLRLAELSGAALATTLKAKDWFRGEPYDLGICGTLGSELGQRMIAESDCIVAFGASLNQFTAAAIPPTATIVHVDSSPDQIGAWTGVDAAVVGDARAVAESMVEMLSSTGGKPTGMRTPELAAAIAAYDPRDEFADLSGDGTVDLRTFTIWLDGVLPPDRNLVTDIGRYVMAPLRFLHVPHPDAAISPLGFGSVGLGLGTAVGLAVARPDAPTVVGIGDGGFMMSLAEFNTAVRYGLDLIAVVYNDGSYSAEYHHFVEHDLDPGISLLDWPDFASVAESLGGSGVTVMSLDETDHVVEAIAERDRPLVIDVRVDPAKKIGFYD